MFLLGKQAMFGHDPPIYLRSTTATRCPCLAKVHAATVDPVPPPRITRSYSSGAAGAFMIVFRCEIFDNVSQSPTKQRSFRWTISARPLDRASTGQCQKSMKLISTPADASKVTTRLLNH